MDQSHSKETKYWPESNFSKKVFLQSVLETEKIEKSIKYSQSVCTEKDILHQCHGKIHAQVQTFVGNMYFSESQRKKISTQIGKGGPLIREKTTKPVTGTISEDQWGQHSPASRIKMINGKLKKSSYV